MSGCFICSVFFFTRLPVARLHIFFYSFYDQLDCSLVFSMETNSLSTSFALLQKNHIRAILSFDAFYLTTLFIYLYVL